MRSFLQQVRRRRARGLRRRAARREGGKGHREWTKRSGSGGRSTSTCSPAWGVQVRGGTRHEGHPRPRGGKPPDRTRLPGAPPRERPAWDRSPTLRATATLRGPGETHVSNPRRYVACPHPERLRDSAFSPIPQRITHGSPTFAPRQLLRQPHRQGPRRLTHVLREARLPGHRR